jgi:hypothetical protein
MAVFFEIDDKEGELVAKSNFPLKREVLSKKERRQGYSI